MEKKNQNKALFELIHCQEGVHSEDIYIFDTTSKYNEHNGEKHYRVFVKGGIMFDIAKERDDDNYKINYQYTFLAYWEGPYGCTSANEVLIILKMLGFEVEFEMESVELTNQNSNHF